MSKLLAFLLASSLYGQVSNYDFRVIPKTDLSSTGSVQWIDKQTTPHYVGFQAPDSVSSNTTWKLPSADATGCLQSDGSLNLSFTSCGAASVINGFFVTNKTAVGPPVTSIGLQVWYDPIVHSSNMFTYNASNGLSPMFITANPLAIGLDMVPVSGNGTGNFGNSSNTFSQAWIRDSVNTHFLQIYGITIPNDLTGSKWDIGAIESTTTKQLNIHDDAGNQVLWLSRMQFSSPKNDGFLDANWSPKIDTASGVVSTGTNCPIGIGGGPATAVCWVSGDHFATGTTWEHDDIVIGIVKYQVATVTDASNLNLTTSVGNTTNQNYSIGYSIGTPGLRWNGIFHNLTVDNCTGCGSQWQSGIPANSIYYSAGNVGIGTNNPNQKLHVVGDVAVDGALRFDASALTQWSMSSLVDTNVLDWIDSLGNTRMRLNNAGILGKGTFLFSPSIFAAPTNVNTQGLVVGRFSSGQVADIFSVQNSTVTSTQYLWVDASGGTHIANCVSGCSGTSSVGVFLQGKSDCGMIMDGTTDDSTAFMNCVTTLLPAQGGTIWLNPGNTKFGGATTVNITKNNVMILGSGGQASGDGEPSTVKTGTQILCTVTPCITFQGATFLGSPYNQNVIFGVRLSNLSLNGNGTSGTLVKNVDVWNSTFDNLALLNHASDYAMVVTSDVNQPACSSRQITFDNVRIGTPNNLQPLASGLRFGDLTNGHEVCSMVLTNITTEVSESPGTHQIFIDNADTIEGSNIHLNGAGGTICCNSSNSSANITITTDGSGNPTVNVLGGFFHNMPVTGLDDGLYIINACDGTVSFQSCGGTKVDALTGMVVGHATSTTQIALTGISGLLPSHTYNAWLIAGTSYASNNALDVMFSSVYTLNSAYGSSSNTHNVVLSGWNWYERCGSSTGCNYNSPYARLSPGISAFGAMGDIRRGNTGTIAIDQSNVVNIGDNANTIGMKTTTQFFSHLQALNNGTQDVGGTTVAFRNGFFLTNVGTKQVSISGTSATDLTSGADSITAEIVAVPQRDRLNFNDASGAGPAMLTLSRKVAGSSVNQAIFDMHLYSLVNSNGTTGYDVGASSFQWRDMYWAGKLVQNGTTRLDAAGNLTVTSCSGCGGGGGVANGYFVTGQSAVAPPSTATGIQMYYDAVTHFGHVKTYDNATNLTGIQQEGFLQLNGNLFPLTDGASDVGIIGNRWRNLRASNGYIGLTPIDTPSDAFLQIAQSSSTVVTVDAYASGTSDLVMRAANGTFAVPLPLTNARVIGGIAARGYDGSSWTSGAGNLQDSSRVSFITNEAWGSGHHGADIYFEASAPGGNRSQIAKLVSAANGANSGFHPVNNLNFSLGTYVSSSFSDPGSANVWAFSNVNQMETRSLKFHDVSPLNPWQGSGGTSFCCFTVQATINPSTTTMDFQDSVGGHMLQLNRNVAFNTVNTAAFDLDPIPLSDSSRSIGNSSTRWGNMWGAKARIGGFLSTASGGEDTVGLIQIIDSGNNALIVDSINSGFAGIPTIIMRKANGTPSSPLTLNTSDIGGLVGARGFNGSTWLLSTAAYMDFVASENWGSSNNGMEIRFATTQNGSNANQARWIIANNGHLIPNSTNTYNLGSPLATIANGYFQNVTINGTCTGSGCAGGNFVTTDTSQTIISTGTKTWNALQTFTAGILMSGNNLTFGGSGVINSSSSSNPLTLQGSIFTNGNIVLSPGNVSSSGSVVVNMSNSTMNGAASVPGFYIVEPATTSSTGKNFDFEIRNNTQIASIFKVINSGDSNCGGCVVANSVFPAQDNLYTLGDVAHYYSSAYINDLYPRVISGAPSCAGITNGRITIDSSNNRIWVCLAGVAKFATLN